LGLLTGLLVATVNSAHQIFLGDKRDGSATSEVVPDVLANFGSVALEAITLGSGASNGGASAHVSGVNGAGDAVGDLHEDLGQVEVLLVECIVLLDVTLGGPVDDVTHLETFDSLVLSDTTTAVHATANVGVTLVLLSASVVSSLRWHI